MDLSLFCFITSIQFIFLFHLDEVAVYNDQHHLSIDADTYSFPNNKIPYLLYSPTNKFKLKDKLDEISGLTYWGPKKLAAVQDEDGKIFIIDTKKEEVIKDFSFHNDGDYEGIELVDGDIYVLRSDGDIYKLKGEDDDKAKKYETILGSKNDTEGLGYLPSENTLLIACKASPSNDKKSFSYARAIYKFDLETKTVDEIPFLLIDLNEVKKYLKESALTRFAREFASMFDPAGDKCFQPSGIAVHPITKDIYIISSVGKLLIVYSAEKELLFVEQLDGEIFKQPEGICFSPDGTLFVSNEARNGKANILQFSYQP